jgi:hypothetical protein
MTHKKTSKDPNPKHKMENKTQKTTKEKNMCSRISNHKKGFENPQLGIMSLKLNNSNPIHT